MRRVFVGLAQVFVGLAAQLRNNRLLLFPIPSTPSSLMTHENGKTGRGNYS